ncbi:hypothetical protein MAR_029729, partial [Mya arenaria]
MYKYFTTNVREGANKLGYLITLSSSTNKLLAEAEAKRVAMNGIQLIVVGMDGAVNRTELESLEPFVSNGGPVTMTTVGSLASTQVLDQQKNYVQTYAASKRLSGTYFPWDGAFDMIILLHDKAGYQNEGLGAKYFLMDLFQRFIVSPKDVMLGVITFGAEVNTGTNQQIQLGSSQYLNDLILKTLNLNLTPTAGTNVDAAMTALGTMFQDHGRADVPHLALLVMEGDVELTGLLDIKTALKERTPPVCTASVGVGPSTSQSIMKALSYNDSLAFMMPSWADIAISPTMDANLVAFSRGVFASQNIGVLRLPNSMLNIIDKTKLFTAILMSGFEMPKVKQGVIGFGTMVTSEIGLGEYNSYLELFINFMSRV